MDDQDKVRIKRQVHPKSEANFLSCLFFCWELPLFAKNQKTDFNEDDLYEPLKEHESKRLGDKLEEHWLEEKKFKDFPSLWRALIKFFGLEFIIYGFVFFFFEIITYFFQPFYLKKLLDYYSPDQTEITKQEAYWYSGYITLLTSSKVIVFHWYKSQMGELSIKSRIAISSMIYRKTLTLKKANFLNVTAGHVVNLLSKDVGSLQYEFLSYIWIAPLEIILIGYYLDVTVGHVTLAGLGIFFLFLILQLFLPNKITQYRKETFLKSDHRIRLMDDLIHGIKVIKMFAWEKPFASLVENARRLELKHVRKANYLRSIAASLHIYLNKGAIFFFLVASVLTKMSLTSQHVFILMLCYEYLKMAVIMVTKATLAVTEFHMSVQRIQEFLMINERETTIESRTYKENCMLTSTKNCQSRETGIHIDHLTVKWNSTSGNCILDDVNFDALPGELIGVIGMAGSGKSTLLQAILQENIISRGNIEINGVISYASQDPWIFSASVKQNILFGAKIDQERYLQVIKICALEHDLSMFPHGDKTLVGERGMMLSGGQKARINLARAIYRKADIYLLDDPLSAVDANVGREIFTQCILGFLKDKCVVLVTHQLHYLQNCKNVYIVDNAKVSLNQEPKELEIVTQNYLKITNKNTLKTDRNLYQEPIEFKEHRGVGSNRRKLYTTYYFSRRICVMLLLFFVFVTFVMSSTDYFLTFWIILDQDVTGVYDNIKQILTTYNRLYVYMFLVLLLFVLALVTIRIVGYYCNKASSVLHDKMLLKILHGTMTFFGQNSSGRILNRFSKDIGTVDELIPVTFIYALIVFLFVFGLCVVICIINYWMVLPAIALFLLCYLFVYIFTPVNINLKRTEAVVHSPILMHLADSLQGLTTIRAFNAQTTLEEEFDNHENLYCTANYLLFEAYTALCFWTDFTCSLYAGLIIFSFLFFEFDIASANIGLAITQSLALVRNIYFVLITCSELDIQMTSVERISEYAELPVEPDGGEIPPEEWPNAGKLSFNSVCVRYSPESPLVLKQVSFDVEASEKIGIVGRTGAGKSSLVSVIFRLFSFEGQIIIDGVDTKTICLNSLRSSISVIPQEPVLFLGTLRSNLDPFDKFTDAELWNVLEEIQLKGIISGLDSVVSEGGNNFSVGERQLICLGRTLLKKSKIIILDEATANVDLVTDKLIQATIRSKFQDSTVLTIAHRLDTIMDSDKILVMEDGCVVEFDHPSHLLANPNSFLYNYCKTNYNNTKSE